jgi:deazaflavin-dependent oxidoreductase (nitroreductase family)
MGDWNTRIIEEFRANEGKVGGQFEDASLILIHHIGAKSGTERVNPVGCFPRLDGRFVIIASNGGAPKNPDWYYNLRAHQEINVEFGTEIFAVTVRELEGAEREQVWADAVSAVPNLGGFQSQTTRTIPVLLLTRTPDTQRDRSAASPSLYRRQAACSLPPVRRHDEYDSP